MLLVAAAVFGWGANIAGVSKMKRKLTILKALRIAGIFIMPLGSILGFCDA